MMGELSANSQRDARIPLSIRSLLCQAGFFSMPQRAEIRKSGLRSRFY